MRLKIFSLFFLIVSHLFSVENLNIQTPLEKDFHYFLDLKNSEKSYEHTIKILENISNVNQAIFDEYAKKIDYDETLAVLQCMNANEKSLVEANSDCIVVGLNLKKALELTPLEINSIILKIEDRYPIFAKELKIINSPIPFTKIVSSSSDIIYDLYLNSSNNFLYEKLNYKLPLKTIEKIKYDEKFERFLSLIISNPKLNFLQSSFFDLDDTNYNYNVSFLLAINRVLNKKIDEQTVIYFKNALSKAISQYEKDKINFWLYLLKNEESTLAVLKESSDLNIYTLYAKKNIKINDSFKILEYEFLKDCFTDRKILIHSFAKTLSNFDVKSISKEFDLGLMQLNLNKVNEIVLLNNLELKEEELLTPKTNILYYSYILNELETEFYHPLTLFYAYVNGAKNLNERLYFNLFETQNIYEPYLSLELLGDEKVKEFIYNYIAYTKIFAKKDLSLEEFFKNLFQPSDFH
ncbi:transglycosylase SLT domain-containing protein [Arcobacter sp.]|uniref:transglycosylase SLT domain-containing protein n=1 Tax=Arcobacter sp. TaxID=1872629 RepID=UPI003D0CB30E